MHYLAKYKILNYILTITCVKIKSNYYTSCLSESHLQVQANLISIKLKNFRVK